MQLSGYRWLPKCRKVICNGTLANEGAWKTVVLITKGDGGYFWGIGSVEVLWRIFMGF